MSEKLTAGDWKDIDTIRREVTKGEAGKPYRAAEWLDDVGLLLHALDERTAERDHFADDHKVLEKVWAVIAPPPGPPFRHVSEWVADLKAERDRLRAAAQDAFHAMGPHAQGCEVCKSALRAHAETFAPFRLWQPPSEEPR